MQIFHKNLLIYLGTLLASLIFLGLVLTHGIRDYLTEQRIAELFNTANRFASVVETRMFNWPSLVHEINMLHQYTGVNILLINTEYQVLFAHGQLEGIEQIDQAEIPIAALSPLMQGERVTLHATASYPTYAPLLVVGYPYRLGDQIVGAVLISTSLSELESAIADMYRITVIALGITGIFAFGLIYLSSRAISRPLRQINEAASIIAGGDLAQRIPVYTKDEVGQLAIQFNRMAESLQDQERIRSEFIANLSHDIRSPLTSMRGFLYALIDGTVPQEEQGYYIGIIIEESERLIKLSNDILEIHRIQASKLTLDITAVDINDLIRKTVLGFKQRATDKSIIITSNFASPAPTLYADDDKIRRCLYNLIDNAIKFTQDGGEISVETTLLPALPGEPEKIQISISDNGRGMSEAECKHVFDRFYKGDASRGEDKMGSGLGLSIVQGIVQAHGGSIAVISTQCEGSVFTLQLPVS